jgi:hypothetical protein
MEESFFDSKTHGVNTICALCVVVIVSLLMVLVTTIMFFRSSSYATVKQIQTGIKASAKSDLSGYDTTSPIKAEDLDSFATSINNKLAPISNNNDFSDNIPTQN